MLQYLAWVYTGAIKIHKPKKPLQQTRKDKKKCKIPSTYIYTRNDQATLQTLAFQLAGKLQWSSSLTYAINFLPGFTLL